MYRRRRYSRGTRSVKSVKYSNETYCQNVPNTIAVADWNDTLMLNLVPAAPVAGMRKAKNFTLSMQYSGFQCPIAFALVYVPEGQAPQQINRAAWSESSTAPTSLYEPNQNVIMQGLLPVTSNSRQEFRTRLARNLNSGDTIFLCLRPIQDINATAQFTAQLNFAICY